MLTNNPAACIRVAFVKLTCRSTRPGRISAESSCSGELEVRISRCPSWLPTPSIAFSRPESEIPVRWTPEVAAAAAAWAWVGKEGSGLLGLGVGVGSSARWSPAVSMSVCEGWITTG